MATSGANLAGTEYQTNPLSERSTAVDGVLDLQHYKPSLSELEYYAAIKRESERNGTSGNG